MKGCRSLSELMVQEHAYMMTLPLGVPYKNTVLSRKI
jgi:hypothetical protein